eukprot:CAMPEP_0197930664 /NCGR_PEP_ID=MMETSP1439-20131203/105835_1 /TAXON_ID=66791 /ORGANISM="Gonyaulax spinifera, Strain CCMP409" /LENGTH=52 /DNA_ID=CAMNT_0043553365 /DNA_START=152 /DNA_END=310 /DNA_ORIENTATION=-
MTGAQPASSTPITMMLTPAAAGIMTPTRFCEQYCGLDRRKSAKRIAPRRALS